MSIELEYKNVKGQALNIIKKDNVTNAEFVFFADGQKYTLTLFDIEDIVDISNLIEAEEFWVESHPKKEGKFVLTLVHQYGVELNINKYAINS